MNKNKYFSLSKDREKIRSEQERVEWKPSWAKVKVREIEGGRWIMHIRKSNVKCFEWDRVDMKILKLSQYDIELVFDIDKWMNNTSTQ